MATKGSNSRAIWSRRKRVACIEQNIGQHLFEQNLLAAHGPRGRAEVHSDLDVGIAQDRAPQFQGALDRCGQWHGLRLCSFRRSPHEAPPMLDHVSLTPHLAELGRSDAWHTTPDRV